MTPLWVHAQFHTHNPVRFASIYLNYTPQSEQQLVDSNGGFRQTGLAFGLVLPLIKKEWNKKKYSSFNLQLQPALNYTRLRTGSGERMLTNPQLAVSSFYTFSTSNRLAVTVRGQLNEDEFTATYPQLLFNGLAYYSRNIGKRLQLHAGGGYSFILGEKQWFPVGGADLSLGTHSRLTLLYPLLASYQYTPTAKLKFAAFAKPTGYMSFFENRLNIPDTNRQTLVFSLQSWSAGLELSWIFAPSMTVSISPAYSPQQHSYLQNKDLTQKYTNHTLSESFVFCVRFVWRPWQTGKRNSNQTPYSFKNDFDIAVPF